MRESGELSLQGPLRVFLFLSLVFSGVKGRKERRKKVSLFVARRFFVLRLLSCCVASPVASALTLHIPEFHLSPLSPPAAPLHKLRNGFYPPRHASRRSVLAAAASTEAMRGAPRRQGDGDRILLKLFFFGSAAPPLLLSACLSLWQQFRLEKSQGRLSPFPLRATATEALCCPFHASRRRARILLAAHAGGKEPRRG